MGTRVISRQPQPAALSAWTIASTCPPEWREWLDTCRGGFFHSPSGLQAGAPPGEQLFCVHFSALGVDAVAVGVRHDCRLSRRPRHVYFPSVPAVREAREAASLVQELVAALRDRGADEVIMDSFDAAQCPELHGTTELVRREEFVLSLEGAPEDMFSRCTPHHRRYIRKGDRSGWAVRTHVGADAHRVLGMVQESARQRAERRGAPFRSAAVTSVADDRFDGRTPWGATVFAAWDGEAMLAAMMVGWGGHRAYYIAGGGTPAGYAVGAGPWLHWQIARTLAAEGLRAYNLGGAALQEPGDPGLRRFKEGFGPTTVACYGARWRLRTLHLRGHAALRWRFGGARA